MLKFYNNLTKALQPVFLPLLSKINDEHTKKKLYYKINGGKKRYVDILIHAVSVGELNVSIALCEALKKIRPNLNLAFTVSTKTGYEKAINTLGKEYPVYIYPLDFPKSVMNFFKVIIPKLYVTIETEIWPNFFYYAKKNNIKISIVNARISKRSYRNYLRIRGLVKETLSLVDGISCISDKFRTRFINLGANPNKIKTNGNAKYELLLNYVKENVNKREYYLEKLNIGQDKRVITYGSIRKKEGEEIIKAVSEVSRNSVEVLQIIAPRHLQFLDYFKGLLEKQSLRYQTLSSVLEDGRQMDIILVDKLGVLMDLYSVSSVSFVGGTLEPVGGHNIMEPAAWSCPVIFGKCVDNVEDAAVELVRNEGGIMVRNWRELVERIKYVLSDNRLNLMGKNAFSTLESLGLNSARRHAEFVLSILE